MRYIKDYEPSLKKKIIEVRRFFVLNIYCTCSCLQEGDALINEVLEKLKCVNAEDFDLILKDLGEKENLFVKGLLGK